MINAYMLNAWIGIRPRPDFSEFADTFNNYITKLTDAIDKDILDSINSGQYAGGRIQLGENTANIIKEITLVPQYHNANYSRNLWFPLKHELEVAGYGIYNPYDHLSFWNLIVTF